MDLSGQVYQVSNFQNDLLILLSVDILFKMALFYISVHILLPQYLASKRISNLLKIFGLFIGTLAISIIVNALIINLIIDYNPQRLSRLFSLTLLLHLLIMLVAVAYRLIKEQYRNEHLKQLVEKEKLQTELDFLKSQINPHFLFNTLNNLFSEARKHENPTLSNGIAKLSHMMRYMLHDSNVAFISLEREVEYLNSYIELQMLRISSEDAFELKKDIPLFNPNIKIAPILFQPFIENAFKHGLSLEDASYVHLSLAIEENVLIFKVENSLSKDIRSIENSGIGLSNIRRRLALIYPNRHEIYTKKLENKFEVILKINL